jgi:hypothetical protein
VFYKLPSVAWGCRPQGSLRSPSVASLPLSLSLLRPSLPSPPAFAGVGLALYGRFAPFSSLPSVASPARLAPCRSPPPIFLPYELIHQLLSAVGLLSLVGVHLSGCFGLLRFASPYTSAPPPGVPLPWVAVLFLCLWFWVLPWRSRSV